MAARTVSGVRWSEHITPVLEDLPYIGYLLVSEQSSRRPWWSGSVFMVSLHPISATSLTISSRLHLRSAATGTGSTRPYYNWTSKFRSQRTSHMEPCSGVARNLIWGVYVLTSHCNFKTCVNVLHVNKTVTDFGVYIPIYPPSLHPWNRLPPALRSPDLSESAFKRALKTHLFSTARRHWDVFMILTPDINIQTYLLTYLTKTLPPPRRTLYHQCGLSVILWARLSVVLSVQKSSVDFTEGVMIGPTIGRIFPLPTPLRHRGFRRFISISHTVTGRC